MGLVDRFNREIDYLRVSVTDRCNFRCQYCMPEEGVPATPKEQTLTFEDHRRILAAAASCGMTKVRFTGGEPLLWKPLTNLVQAAKEIGFQDISATTNGYLLGGLAKPLAEAGLDRINVSLDTLDPKRFKAIARRGDLATVLAGIEAAFEAGLSPVKLNCVVMKGFNDDEVDDLARWTMDRELHVRFIELMPIRWNLDETEPFDSFAPHGSRGLLQLTQAQGTMLSSREMRTLFVSSEESKARIERETGPLFDAEVVTNGPARSYRLEGARGTVGFISQITNDFCSRCNRLRVTHDGFLRPCLMSDGELDLKPALRAGAGLVEAFRHVVEHKPERHYLAEGQQVTGRSMSQIGG